MDQRLLLMHQAMLADKRRVQAYDAALQRTVKPGDVVVDIGAGTLVLSMMALRHGAGHVYAIEADPAMAAVATRIAAANELKQRLTLIVGDARTTRLPVRADVVVCEMMGNLGPEEQMAEVLDAVVTRELRAGGRVVPLRMRTHFAAIEFDGEGWGLWGEDFLGYRLDEVQQCVAPQAQLHFFQHHPNLLSEPVRILDSADGQAAGRPRAGHRLRIERPGQLHAIMGYFTVDLTDDVSLSNFPSYPGCNWAVWIWPLKHIRVEAGDEVRMQIRRPSGPGGVRLATSWRLECGVVRQRRL